MVILRLSAAELEGDAAQAHVPAGAAIEHADGEALMEIDFDDEDETNIYRHARHNAQEAIALAKRRAEDFDTQAALLRKTNEALKLAKGHSRVREEESTEATGSSTTPLVDCEFSVWIEEAAKAQLTFIPSGFGRVQLPAPHILEWRTHDLTTRYADGHAQGVPAEGIELARDIIRARYQRYLGGRDGSWQGKFKVYSPLRFITNNYQ